jgi:histidine triad (HIT) family protein
MPACIFCKIIAKEIPAEIVFENELFVAFRDIKPKSPGHTLIVPKKHYATLLDMPVSSGTLFFELAQKVARELLEKGKGSGFNLVMNNFEVAGQVVPHAHLHVIPRTENDGIRLLS